MYKTISRSARRVKFLITLFFISCSTSTIGQINYYYYKGKRVSLIDNDTKVCVSISKDRNELSKKILQNVTVLEKIGDDSLDIFIIYKSDLEKIKSSLFWNENSKYIIVTTCYKTTDNIEVFASPYLNVKLKNKKDIDLLSSYAKKNELTIVRQDSLLPLWYILSITPDSGNNTLTCANKMWESGLFAASIPDLCSNDLICSNDPLFNQQWGLQNNNYPGIDISVSSAWDYATGKDIKIAILDQGVDMGHMDLAPNISVVSYDTESNSSPSILYGYHATHCAGIAAAVKDNEIQIAGVAPEATIVSISNSLQSTTNSQLKRANGIVWAYQNGVDIISNSWRSGMYHSAIDEAIKDAFRYGRQGKGCIIVFASGNDNSSVCYPANCNDTILAVGAIDRTGSKASFSNYGAELDLVAPGVNILSTLPDNSTGYNDGTSMACPHVAGVAALILERNSELTVNEVNSIINSNAKKITGVNFSISKPDGLWNNEYGYGLVDAYNAVINTPGTAYIQNDTIIGTRVISADSIFVGKDVTDAKEYGDVRIGPGDILLKGKSTKIKNCTFVPIGTILKVEH